MVICPEQDQPVWPQRGDHASTFTFRQAQGFFQYVWAYGSAAMLIGVLPRTLPMDLVMSAKLCLIPHASLLPTSLSMAAKLTPRTSWLQYAGALRFAADGRERSIMPLTMPCS